MPRLTWHDLPAAVRSRVQDVLGETVVSTRSCTGGFSPSTAEIVRGTTGCEVFVKAVRAADNPDSIALNRQEARVLASIPDTAPVPALRAAFEEGPWLVLVADAVDGTTATEPWSCGRLDAVLTALDALQAATTPSPVEDLPRVEELLGEELRGFDRVAADPPVNLDPWLAARLPELRDAAVRGITALAGETLCHSDLRADNIMISAEGTVRLVDWAWGSLGSRWSDAVQLLSSVDDPDGHLDVNGRLDAILDRHGVPRTVGTQMLAGILGFFVDAARVPDPPTLPGLGAHRARRRDLLLRTVRERWEERMDDAPAPSPRSRA